MHIPNGYLAPVFCAVTYGLAAPLWFATINNIRNDVSSKNRTALALAAGFIFLIMMFNIPIKDGSTGHAVGATLFAIIFGPWISALLTTIVLAVQSVFFGDGGTMCFAANSLIIAYFGAFAGWGINKLLTGKKTDNFASNVFAAGFSGYLSLSLSAALTGFVLGLQSWLFHSNAGIPLYFPFPIKTAIGAMLYEHMTVFGFAEAFITAAGVGLFILVKRGLFAGRKTIETEY